MARRKNPDSAGFYLALAAAGAVLYYVLRPSTPSGGSGSGIGIGGDGYQPPIGGDGSSPPSTEGTMPSAKAQQLQSNINIFRAATNSGPAIAVDGKFGPISFAAVNDLRVKCSPAAERLRGASGLALLKDATVFYDPTPSDTVTFRLYGSQQNSTLRNSLYGLLSNAPLTITADELEALKG